MTAQRVNVAFHLKIGMSEGARSNHDIFSLRGEGAHP